MQGDVICDQVSICRFDFPCRILEKDSFVENVYIVLASLIKFV